MQNLHIDTGIQEFQINDSGVLRFNPSDPNVYNRFFGITEKVGKIDEEMAKEISELPEGDGEGALKALQSADAKAKALLNEVFGLDNDFNQILGGVNIMAAGINGKRVIVNLFEALTPIVRDGAKKCADAKLKSAKLAREQRRKLAKQ